MSKLGIDWSLVEKARGYASNIANSLSEYVQDYSTVSVERTICRFLGIDGINEDDVPLPNIVVDHMKEKNILINGAAYIIGNAMIELNISPQEIAEKVANGDLDLSKITPHSAEDSLNKIESIVNSTIEKIKENKKYRDDFVNNIGEGTQPYLYVIVATGNVYEDVIQAKAAARQGADIIAVIRSTGQSLLDYVPYGPTTEGFGGTFATQENFKIMREALDEVGHELGRYIRLVNYASGLCMPEIAAMGAVERLDVMLNDALY